MRKLKKLMLLAGIGILISGCGAKETELDRELVQNRETQKGNEDDSRKLCVFSLERGEN